MKTLPSLALRSWLGIKYLTKVLKSLTCIVDNGTMVIGRQFVDRDWDYGSVMVDELTVWEEKLSQQEIMRLYNSTV